MPAIYIETSKPTSVFLYFTGCLYDGGNGYGDPSMVIINPIDQKINNITFSTFCINNSNYQHFVNIVTNTNNIQNMKLNDTNIFSHFNLVPYAPVYSYARIGISHGSHTISNTYSEEENGFIAHIYGLGSMESYSYSSGSMVIDLSPQLLVNGLYSLDNPNGFEICENIDNSFNFDLNIKDIPSNVLWNFGDGTTGEGYPITHNYYGTGTYNIICYIYKMINGIERLDTTLTTLLSIKPTYDTTIIASICSNERYIDNGFNENKTGIYIDTLHTIYGCDSIVRLNLTVNPIYNDTILAYICDGEVYDLHGFYENRDTIVTQELQTIYGCDSIVTLNLKIGKTYIDTIHATIKEGEYYDENGFYECESGIHVKYFTTPFGCDSILYLFLQITSEPNLYIPNCIMPHHPINNKFEIIHNESLAIDDVYIYNRAGGLIFNSPNNSESWDGKYKGKYCPQAAYAYLIYYRQVGTIGQKVKTGIVLLIY